MIMMVSVCSSVYLLLLVLSGTLSSAQDHFYLTLRYVERESLARDLGVWSSGTSESNNDTTSATTQCEFRSREVPVSCSCGSGLENSIRDYQETREATCDESDEYPASPFGFCANSLRSLGCGYEIHNERIAPSANLEVFNDSTLSERIGQMENQLRLFRKVLDRTIVGLLVETDRDKCFCLVSVAMSTFTL